MSHFPLTGLGVKTIFWLGTQFTFSTAVAAEWSFLFAGSCGHGHASWLLLRVGVRARGAMKQLIVRLLKYQHRVNQSVELCNGELVVVFAGLEFGGNGFTGNG